jgi:hypothetical protein
VHVEVRVTQDRLRDDRREMTFVVKEPRAAPFTGDGKVVSGLEADLYIEVQCDGEDVKARAEVG